MQWVEGKLCFIAISLIVLSMKPFGSLTLSHCLSDLNSFLFSKTIVQMMFLACLHASDTIFFFALVDPFGCPPLLLKGGGGGGSPSWWYCLLDLLLLSA